MHMPQPHINVALGLPLTFLHSKRQNINRIESEQKSTHSKKKKKKYIYIYIYICTCHNPTLMLHWDFLLHSKQETLKVHVLP